MGDAAGRRKKVVILGSTGSIGTSALKVARQLPECMEVVGLAAGTRVKDLAAQAAEFGVKHVAIADEGRVEELRGLVPEGTTVHAGKTGLLEMAVLDEADMVLVSIVGTDGLRPALEARQYPLGQHRQGEGGTDQQASQKRKACK